MPKMKVGRKVVYLEIFEVDVDKVPSGRDDLDLCRSVVCWAADPVFTQKIKMGPDKWNSCIRLLSRTMDCVNGELIHPVPNFELGSDECPQIESEAENAFGTYTVETLNKCLSCGTKWYLGIFRQIDCPNCHGDPGKVLTSCEAPGDFEDFRCRTCGTLWQQSGTVPAECPTCKE